MSHTLMYICIDSLENFERALEPEIIPERVIRIGEVTDETVTKYIIIEPN